MKLIPVILACALVLSSIGSCEGLRHKKKQEIAVKPTLIHPFFFQDEIAQVLNFPFWFNDSIIREQKINTITWITYGSKLDTDDENDRIEHLPKRTVVYVFNRAGKPVSMQQTDFSEGIIISSSTLTLKPLGNSGYYSVSEGDNLFGVENNAYVVVRSGNKKNVKQYDNEETDERLHFIANEKFHSPLSVDSIAKPEANDWIILGTYNRPLKRYKVQNKVREKQVTTYTYWNGNFPKQTVNDDFPFTKKRSYTYRNGTFSGYIDSTFIDNSFVTSSITSIHYKNGLPTSVVHIKQHSESENSFRKTEAFQYTRFKD